MPRTPSTSCPNAWSDARVFPDGADRQDQKGFFEFYAEEILPALKSIKTPSRKAKSRRGAKR